MRSFWKIYRVSNWIQSLIPLLLGHIFFFVLFFKISVNIWLAKLILLFLISSFGFAGFGYIINEFFDKKTDQAAGKLNVLQNSSISSFVIYLSISIGLAVSPWFFLPISINILGLLSIQILFFLLYSLPSIRLKEKPFLSNILDASYAYLIPFLLVREFATIISNQSFESILFLIFSMMLFVVGFTNLFIHQLLDLANDKSARTLSTPIFLGPDNSRKTMILLLVLSVFCTFLFCVVLIFNHLNWSGLLVIFFLLLISSFRNKDSSVESAFENEINFGLFLNQFYQFYLPIFYLGLLCCQSWIWWIVLILFIFVFQNLKSLKEKLLLFIPLLQLLIFLVKKIKKITSSIGNQILYLSFRLFGVDLVKEKKSAWEFLKKKCKQ